MNRRFFAAKEIEKRIVYGILCSSLYRIRYFMFFSISDTVCSSFVIRYDRLRYKYRIWYIGRNCRKRRNAFAVKT